MVRCLPNKRALLPLASPQTLTPSGSQVIPRSHLNNHSQKVSEAFSILYGIQHTLLTRPFFNLIAALHLLGPSALAVIAENNRQAALEKSFIQENSLKLKEQIDSIASYISEQSAYLFSLKNSISKQTKLHGQLMHKLSQLDPTLLSTSSTYKLLLHTVLCSMINCVVSCTLSVVLAVFFTQI